MFLIAVLFVWFFPITESSLLGGEPCRIEIRDDENDWPVPLVELRTTHHERFVSDNAGVIAFDLHELMGKETWFSVEGHGYAVKKDGFGYAGVRLTPEPGKRIVVQVHRELPAKRLGRITGGGLFAESQKLGEHADWHEQGILGCDSVQNVIHRGKLFWAWGDTILPHYPLGRFHMIAATTQTQPLESFEPPLKLRYDYFIDEQNVPRDVARMPGDGPTWLSGVTSVVDQQGDDRLVATYSKIRPPLSEYERGLCVWDEQTRNFEKLKVLWQQSTEQPHPPVGLLGHPVRWEDPSGQTWLLFGDPFPEVRCRATYEDWSNPDSWEQLNPQKSVPAIDSKEMIKPHRGAIAWNAYRRKWVAIFTQLGGETSYLGELWYAEADAPTGPWNDARHIVTHNKYTFYNPQLHPEWGPERSPILLFEATYTHTFSKTTDPTPRHDYNQVLYRLDLDELIDE